MDKTYNGWKNYETWLVNLWIDNDGEDCYWHERAAELRDTFELAQEMDAHYTALSEEVIPEGGMFNDLFNSALRGVCWYDIAQHYIAALQVEEAV
jgi:hypothetical protein